MKDMGIIQGSAAQAVPLVVSKDTVYVHTNIKQVIEDGKLVDNLFSYNEVQYDKDEYIQFLGVALADADAFNIDHELRLTLLESGGV